jgi:hypothetical protein
LCSGEDVGAPEGTGHPGEMLGPIARSH